MSKFTAACVQMRSGVTIAANIQSAAQLIQQAALQGADLVVTPEMTNLLDITGRSRANIVTEGDDLSVRAFRQLAAQLDIWLLIGSVAVHHDDDERLANRSVLISPEGDVVARYDKIHMFDVDIDDGQSYRESKTYRPGDSAVLVRTPLGAIGMTVCYDVRFPHLYRALARAGAELLSIPAAFTRVTGEAHWHTLLKARAIETGSFVIAPAQGGVHEDGRETFGHSLIIGPWGDILAEADGIEPGIITASIDLSEVAKVRARIPSLITDKAVGVREYSA